MNLLDLRDDLDAEYEHPKDHLYHVEGSLHFVHVGTTLYVRLMLQKEGLATVVSGKRRKKPLDLV
jgi:hypothetical protein